MAGVGLFKDDESYEEIMDEYRGKRILVFNDEVDDYLLENFVLYIIKWNREDEHIPVDERIPIKIYINSPGGNTLSANIFMDAIMTSETPVVGVAFGLVASAAYYIYLACDTRYAYKHSTILQHDGSIGLENSNKKAKDTMKYLSQVDENIRKFVLARTDITPEFYDEIFDSEFYMTPEKAKALGVVHRIIGEDCGFKEIW